MEGRPGGTGGKPTKYTYGMKQEMALYDVEIDPGETTDVQHAHPEVVARMLELVEAARVPRFTALVDPDDPLFLAPGDMPSRIAAACRDRGETPPQSQAEMVRCILDSLALAYRRTVRQASALSGPCFRRNMARLWRVLATCGCSSPCTFLLISKLCL